MCIKIIITQLTQPPAKYRIHYSKQNRNKSQSFSICKKQPSSSAETHTCAHNTQIQQRPGLAVSSCAQIYTSYKSNPPNIFALKHNVVQQARSATPFKCTKRLATQTSVVVWDSRWTIYMYVVWEECRDGQQSISWAIANVVTDFCNYQTSAVLSIC